MKDESEELWLRWSTVVLNQNRTKDSRRVNDEPIPLTLDVIIGRLFSDVQTIKLKLPGDLLFPLEDHQRNLGGTRELQVSSSPAKMDSRRTLEA